MANFFPAILVLLVLCISVHVQARESQFFSKFTANADVKDANTDTVVNRAGPAKEQAELLDKKARDLPVFVAESRNGYGLYGHETGQLPNSDVATTTSFADEPYYNKERNYAGFYDKDTYADDEEIARDTNAKLQGSSYTAAENSRNNNNNNYFSAEEQRFRNTAVNGQNNYYMGGNRYTANGNKVQQQGMSDTRFLENGKYYYHIDDEEKYNPTRYTEPRNVEFDSNQEYLPNANGNNNHDNGNEYNGNYYAADNYVSENAKVMAGGYDPVKNQYMFRSTKNNFEFTP